MVGNTVDVGGPTIRSGCLPITGHETERAGYLADGIRGWAARVVLPKGYETERAGYLADGVGGRKGVRWTAMQV